MKNIMTVENLCKEYLDESGFKIQLFQNINFSIEENIITTILAPTGSGKSSLMKIISHIEEPTSGEIIKQTNTKEIFIPTKASSFPWLSVKENISFNSNNNEVQKIINSVGLEGYEDHFPNNKSLGFRFRISLGRALAQNPNLIVLDEPFAKMDTETKEEIYNLILSINDEYNVSILLGTTKITEAIYLSDKIYLMKNDPSEIIKQIDCNFDKPRNLSLLNNDEFKNLRSEIEKTFYVNQSHKLFNLSI